MRRIMVPSSYSIFRFLNLRSRVSLAKACWRAAISFNAWRILVRALEVVTMFSQSCLGVCVFDVIISTWSPLCSICFSCTFLPFTFAPIHLQPSLLWMWNAKSSTVEPLASLNKSPLGVNTNTSSSYKSSLNWSIVSSPLLSELSKASRTEVSHSSRPDSPFTPLYRQWAARPRSAISSMRSVRICTSTHLPSGPITVMCSDSYPLLLGTDSQSRSLFGLGWYISVTME